MFNEKQKKWLIVLLIVIILAVLGIIAIFMLREQEDDEKPQEEIATQTEQDIVYFDGEAYKYNYNLKNILFLGIDNETEIDYDNIPGAGGQADCIMLLSLDRENKTVRVLQISRDSMTEIDIYDSNGNKYSTMQGQLALQYAYGNGAKNSSWAMKKTVSELLFELPIDGYITMDIAAVSKINDLLGGVTLTIPEDYTDIDPAFVAGATLTLNGEQAERYVRYRDITVAESSHTRMRRQVQYIPALLETFESKVGDNVDKMKQLYSGVADFVLTDLSFDDMTAMLDYSWNSDEVEYLDGEVVKGEKYEEFYVDDEKLQEKIIKMFYILR